MDLTVLLDIAKVSVGLIYLYLEYNARRSLWFVSIIMPIISIFLFWKKGLYADMGLNLYYLAIAIYGLYKWKNNNKNSARIQLPISHIPRKKALLLIAATVFAWAIIAYILIMYTDSKVPYLDSFTTAMSFAGMWMLANKWIEQWLIWFIVDAVYVYLYYYKGIYFSGSLYLFYTIMATIGYRKWLKMMHTENKNTDKLAN